MKSYIPLLIATALLLSGCQEEVVSPIDELKESFEKSIASQDREALFALYHTEGFDEASINSLKESINRTLGIKEFSKEYSVKYFSFLDQTNYGSRIKGMSLEYYPYRYLNGGFYVDYTSKTWESSGETIVFPLVYLDGAYHLAANKIEPISEALKLKTYRIGLKNDRHEVVAPLQVTYTIGRYIQTQEISTKRRPLRLTTLLSVSCPPLPNIGRATLQAVNTRDKNDVLVEFEFDASLGLNWNNTMD